MIRSQKALVFAVNNTWYVLKKLLFLLASVFAANKTWYFHKKLLFLLLTKLYICSQKAKCRQVSFSINIPSFSFGGHLNACCKLNGLRWEMMIVMGEITIMNSYMMKYQVGCWDQQSWVLFNKHVRINPYQHSRYF